MLEDVLYAIEILEGMRRVLLCLQEVMRCMPLCMLEAVEDELCLLEVMHRVLLCMLEAVEGELCLLEGLG